MTETDIILSVQDLDVKFDLRGRTLHAIRGVSLDVYRGESLAIVGESGSGKSVFTKSFMGLLDQNGYIAGGHILYGGQDLAGYASEKQWLTIRGREIAMVLQDPMTSLNPLKTIGRQIEEAVVLHQGLKGDAARPSPTWASTTRSAGTASTLTSSPAACASGWSSPSLWPAAPRSSSVTSPPPPWT